MFVSAWMDVSGWAKDVGQIRFQEEFAVWNTWGGKIRTWSQNMEWRSEQKAKSDGKDYTDNLVDSSMKHIGAQ